MKRLPDRPNLDQLKRQAKDLLAAYRGGDVDAFSRFRDALPVAARKDDAALAALSLRLHDAQSCVAREYGFVSWADLRSFVHARGAYRADGDKGVLDWLRLVYGGHIAGGNSRARPTVAARVLEDNPGLLGDDTYLACAAGDEAELRRALSGNRAWVNSAGGPLDLPPLVAVTHSSLLRLPGFRESLHACANCCWRPARIPIRP